MRLSRSYICETITVVGIGYEKVLIKVSWILVCLLAWRSSVGCMERNLCTYGHRLDRLLQGLPDDLLVEVVLEGAVWWRYVGLVRWCGYGKARSQKGLLLLVWLGTYIHSMWMFQSFIGL